MSINTETRTISVTMDIVTFRLLQQLAHDEDLEDGNCNPNLDEMLSRLVLDRAKEADLILGYDFNADEEEDADDDNV